MVRPAKKTTPKKATKRPAWEEKLLKEARAERARKKKPFIKRALGKKTSTSTSTKKRSVAWRITKGTVAGTAKFTAKQTGKAWNKGATKVKKWKSDRKFEGDYVPEPGEIPRAMRVPGATYVGEKKFATALAAMTYAEKVAAADPEAKLADRTRTKIEISRWGTVRVAPATRKPPAKKRRRRPEARPSRTDALIKAHRNKINTTGKAAMAENKVASMFRKAFLELDDNKPRKLSGMEELALGMEQAQALAAEVVQNYRMFLIQKGFDPADLMPLANVQKNYEAAALEWTKHIVVIKDNLAAEIAEAKRRKNKAEGRNVPDDETLAG